MSWNQVLLTAVAAAVAWGANPSHVPAQVVVQQPQVEVFRLDTAVSVPDRGAIFLGGVNQAAGGQQRFGPFWWGSSLGWTGSSTGASAHVWIHDLKAMDEAILAEARILDARADRVRRQSEGPARRLIQVDSPADAAVRSQAARAREQLLQRHLSSRR